VKYSSQLALGSFLSLVLVWVFELDLIYLIFVTQAAIGAMICKLIEKQGEALTKPTFKINPNEHNHVADVVRKAQKAWHRQNMDEEIKKHIKNESS
jgi:hypothetical protein